MDLIFVTSFISPENIFGDKLSVISQNMSEFQIQMLLNEN